MNDHILLTAPLFHGYAESIKSAIERTGRDCTYIPENTIGLRYRILDNFHLSKIEINLFHNRVKRKIASHNITHLFIIRGDYWTAEKLLDFKKRNPEIKIILYQWDSIARHDYRDLLPHTDDAFTFDPHDSKVFSINYLPLFYENEWGDIRPGDNNSACFIGTAHGDRPEILLKISKLLENKKVDCSFYLYLPFFTWLKRVLLRTGKLSDYKNINFQPIKKEEVRARFALASVVIDIHNEGQSGLTMRTFEALGAKRKLITTNIQVLREKKINPENVLVIDRKTPEIPDKFIQSPFKPSREHKYSLTHWINSIFKDSTK